MQNYLEGSHKSTKEDSKPVCPVQRGTENLLQPSCTKGKEDTKKRSAGKGSENTVQKAGEKGSVSQKQILKKPNIGLECKKRKLHVEYIFKIVLYLNTKFLLF